MAGREPLAVLDPRQHFQTIGTAWGSSAGRPGLDRGPVEGFAGTDQSPPEPPIGVAMPAHMKREGFMEGAGLDPVREQWLGVFDNESRLLTAPPAGGDGGRWFDRDRGFTTYRFT